MKQKLLIFLILILMLVLLAGLNAATYVQKEKVADSEFAPNRSTFNPGSTGTQALYALLSETGRNVTRWQSALDDLDPDAVDKPSVFVMIGPFRRALAEGESAKLFAWVSAGGTLVLIDRDPSSDLLRTTAQWELSVPPQVSPDLYTVEATDQKQMTDGSPARKPIQPSGFAFGVNAVQPSRFASPIRLARKDDDIVTAGNDVGVKESPTPFDFYSGGEPERSPSPIPPPPPPARDYGEGSGSADAESYEASEETPEDELFAPRFEAPLVHIGGKDNSLLVEAPFDQGRVIVLSDPYIVSNNGIGLVDNSQLAINILTSRPGRIAFDEYHHGFGANNNRFFQYFEGTPVIAIFLQIGLVVALIFYSQSRRFGRPVPEPEPSRLSKLEYVSAMAELQQRTRAYDLAIENIYSDFRRRVAAQVGLDNTTATRKDLAMRIAERIRGDAREIEELMFRCEDTIHGEPISKKDTVSIIERLRALEAKLGLQRSARKGL